MSKWIKSDDRAVPVDALRKYIKYMIEDSIGRGETVTKAEVEEWVLGDIDQYITIDELIEEVKEEASSEEE